MLNITLLPSLRSPAGLQMLHALAVGPVLTWNGQVCVGPGFWAGSCCLAGVHAPRRVCGLGLLKASVGMLWEGQGW